MDIAAAGAVVVTHRLAPRGAPRTVRLPEHTAALERMVLGAFSSERPYKRKVNPPPSDAALAIAAELAGDGGTDPVIDLDPPECFVRKSTRPLPLPVVAWINNPKEAVDSENR